LRGAVNPGDAERKERIQHVSDLTFGEYIRLLEVPENWCRLGLNLDRPLIVERLSKIREIRNEVMHFHPDGISDGETRYARGNRSVYARTIKLSGSAAAIHIA
jgi:hypothetical protein